MKSSVEGGEMKSEKLLGSTVKRDGPGGVNPEPRSVNWLPRPLSGGPGRAGPVRDAPA